MIQVHVGATPWKLESSRRHNLFNELEGLYFFER